MLSVPLARMVTLELREPRDLVDLLEREESRVPLVLQDSRVCLDLKELLERLGNQESRVWLERAELPDRLALEVTEGSPVSVVPLAQRDLPVLVVLLALPVTTVLRVRLVPQEPPELRGPQVCRGCPGSVAPLACLDSRETEETKEARVLTAPLVRMASGA